MKRPCINGLKQFKNGCPQKCWSIENTNGCPAWKELVISNLENPEKKEIKAQCILEWEFEFQWAMLGLLEGNQKAIESFRNGMVETDVNGKDRPKPDPGIILLYNLFQNMRTEKQIILKHETKKIIDQT